MRIAWANLLTWTRLVLIVPISIFVVYANVGWALALYLVAIATDLFDGPVARLTNTASLEGAQLDGSVDLIFMAGAVMWFWRLFPAVIADYARLLFLVAASFTVFIVLSLALHRRIVTPHYWSGKLAMVLASLVLPVTIIFGEVSWFMYCALIVAVLGRVEIIVGLLRGVRDLDARSVIF